jgi:phenylacetate-CoA ligase
MDGVPAGGWQVAKEREELNVLLSGVREGFADATLVDSLRRELEAQGALVPPVKVRRVPAIPRTTVGKAPLIKADSLPYSGKER